MSQWRGYDEDRRPPRRPGRGRSREDGYPRHRPGASGRRGSLPGRTGVIIVAGSALLGALGTVLTGSQPGTLLGVCLLLGTVAASLAVERRSAYLVVPVPPLAYAVAALVSGYFGSPGASSKTALALGALQWIANGFVLMLVATLLAAGIAGARWWLAARRSTSRQVGVRSPPPGRTRPRW